MRYGTFLVNNSLSVGKEVSDLVVHCRGALTIEEAPIPEEYWKSVLDVCILESKLQNLRFSWLHWIVGDQIHRFVNWNTKDFIATCEKYRQVCFIHVHQTSFSYDLLKDEYPNLVVEPRGSRFWPYTGYCMNTIKYTFLDMPIHQQKCLMWGRESDYTVQAQIDSIVESVKGGYQKRVPILIPRSNLITGKDWLVFRKLQERIKKFGSNNVVVLIFEDETHPDLLRNMRLL